MLRGWKMTNREKAERDTFYYLKGYLESAFEDREEISIREILECMDKFVDEQTKSLNERFPEYAE